MNLKFAEELCVMTMNNNAKYEWKLTFHFKMKFPFQNEEFNKF